MREFLLQKEYMALDGPRRSRVRSDFGLRRDGVTELVGNTVVSDGVTQEQCMRVTSDALRSRLGAEYAEGGNFMSLWEAYVASLDFKGESEPVQTIAPPLPAVGSVDPKVGQAASTVTAFCDSCDGKKAHKVYCKNK